MNIGFYNWWRRLDVLIRKGLQLLLAILLISQVILMNQTAKTFISRTDRLEGKAVEDSQLYIKTGEVEISVENYSTLRPLVFYVNGEKQTNPAGKAIKLQVKDGDVLEVSGAKCSDTIILKVTAASEDITVPELGKLIYVNNNLVMVDRVRLK